MSFRGRVPPFLTGMASVTCQCCLKVAGDTWLMPSPRHAVVMKHLCVGQVLLCPASGMHWQVMHSIPGRLRLRRVDCSLDPFQVQALIHQALQRRWVRRVRANAMAGSLTLEGDPRRLTHKRAVLMLLQQSAQQEVALSLSIAPSVNAQALRRLSFVLALFGVNALLDLPMLLLLFPVGPLLFLPLLRAFWSERRAGQIPAKTLDLLWYGSLAFRGHGQALLLEWGIELGNHSLKRWTPGPDQCTLLRERLEDFRQRCSVRLQTSDGALAEIPSASLRAGDHLRLLKGERLPCHGQVVQGAGTVASLWADGRSVQIPVRPFQQLPAGIRLVSGDLVIRVIATEDPLQPEDQRTQVMASEVAPPPIIEASRRLHSRTVPLILMAGGGLLLSGQSSRAAGLLQFDPLSDWELSCSLQLGALQRDALNLGMVLQRPESCAAVAASHQLLITESVLGRFMSMELESLHPLMDASADELVQILAGFRCKQRPFGLTAYTTLLQAMDLDPCSVEEIEMNGSFGWRGQVLGEQIEIGGPNLLRARQLHHSGDLGPIGHRTWIYVIRSGQLVGGVTFKVSQSRRVLRALRRLKRSGVQITLMMRWDMQYANLLRQRLDLPDQNVVFEPDVSKQLAWLGQCRSQGPVMLLAGEDTDVPLIAAADVGMRISDLDQAFSQELADVLIAPRCIDQLPVLVNLCQRFQRRQKEQVIWVLMPHLLVVLVNLVIPLNPLVAVILVDLPILTADIFNSRSVASLMRGKRA